MLATGERHPVREFYVEKAFARVDIDIEWRGSGIQEKVSTLAQARCWLEIDSARHFRPTEVDLLLGDSVQSTPAARLAAMQKQSF